jgi:type I restriction enzyme, S subunit
MRESGVEWLGEVPEHWRVERLAYQFKERDERNRPELPLLEVSLNHGVIRREFSSDKIESTASDFNTYKVARQGDIVFNKMRMWQGAVGAAPIDGLVSPDYVVAEPVGDLLSRFAAMLFRIPAFSAECGRRSYGLVWDRLRLYWDGFRDIRVAVPPRAEQEAIVRTVSDRCGSMDAFESQMQRSIAFLHERRGALIAAAVTGVIDVEDAA